MIAQEAIKSMESLLEALLDANCDTPEEKAAYLAAAKASPEWENFTKEILKAAKSEGTA